MGYRKNIRNAKWTFDFDGRILEHIRIEIPCWPTCWYAPQIAQTCHFSLFLQICWPTFLNFLRNVGQHFSLIFSFSNMFVHKANRTNMLANMLVSRCWSKCWPTCCPVCARLYGLFPFCCGNFRNGRYCTYFVYIESHPDLNPLKMQYTRMFFGGIFGATDSQHGHNQVYTLL